MSLLKDYKNFTISKQEIHPEIGLPILYHEDEEGRDWYELQSTFNADTIKIGYNADGVIVTASKDVWAIAPTGLSVTETWSLPDDFELGQFVISDGAIVRQMPDNSEIIDAARERKRQLIEEVSLEIDVLKDAEELGDLTEREAQRLAALKNYRVELMRVDISKEGEIWPIKPRSIL
ncbi:tail fiber related protein [Yersinia phage vB_Yen_X1]|nr:tail fiber related protein [Yersinia phage vB_Yen_X1]